MLIRAASPMVNMLGTCLDILGLLMNDILVYHSIQMIMILYVYSYRSMLYLIHRLLVD